MSAPRLEDYRRPDGGTDYDGFMVALAAHDPEGHRRLDRALRAVLDYAEGTGSIEAAAEAVRDGYGDEAVDSLMARLRGESCDGR